MDPTENIVLRHLKHLGYTNVIYEPDGNMPPDFLVDESIAIEVRRLNQNHVEGGNTKGLEEVAIPLSKRVEKLLGELGAPVGSESWFVFFRFSRPVEAWRILEPKLRKALNTFRDSNAKQPGCIVKANGFELDVFRASKPHATMFIIGGYSDEESGGWLLTEMDKNIRYCTSEKSRKITSVRTKYGKWWLALVDHIGYGLGDFDRKMFRDQVSIVHDWDKVIVIDPNNPTIWFEI